MQAPLFGAVALALALTACDRSAREPDRSSPPSATTTAPAQVARAAPLSSKLAHPAPARLVAIGDLHGDLDHTRRALKLAGAIGAHDEWIGGALVVVQTGDEIDRGDDDRAILDLMDSVQKQARGAGGDVVALLGNHEIMNASLDFRYVTKGGFDAFAMYASPDGGAPSSVPENARGRAAAFMPGGGYALMLARRPIFAEVGDSLFVHGGILPKHVAYGLDKMNDEVDAWLRGERRDPPAVVVADDGPIWTRLYSSDEDATACATLTQALTALGAKRMVVGHTVQHGGVTSACDGKVWRIDVGLAHYFGGPIEALELSGDSAKVLRE